MTYLLDLRASSILIDLRFSRPAVEQLSDATDASEPIKFRVPIKKAAVTTDLLMIFVGLYCALIEIGRVKRHVINYCP